MADNVFRRVCVAIMLVSAAALSACVDTTSAPRPQTEFERLNAMLRETVLAMSRVSDEEARGLYADKTTATFGGGHGTQVSYRTPDGRCFLWYPGNRNVLPCEWKIVRQPYPHADIVGEEVEVPTVCYRYGSYTYNPVTKTRGGDWQCRSAIMIRGRQGGQQEIALPTPWEGSAESVDGDRYGLARRGPVPFVMEKKKRYSFEELDERL